jgi:hypothetical protein
MIGRFRLWLVRALDPDGTQALRLTIRRHRYQERLETLMAVAQRLQRSPQAISREQVFEVLDEVRREPGW